MTNKAYKTSNPDCLPFYESFKAVINNSCFYFDSWTKRGAGPYNEIVVQFDFENNTAIETDYLGDGLSQSERWLMRGKYMFELYTINMPSLEPTVVINYMVTSAVIASIMTL